MTNIQATILRTLAYFAVTEFPMTAMELFRFQLKPERIYSLREIVLALDDLEEVQSLQGYYALKQHPIQKWVHERYNRYPFAIRKYKKAQRLAGWLKCLPFVEAVAICNTRLPLHYAPDESDIDLFMIVKPGHAWTARFLSLLPLKVFKLRSGEVTKDGFDLSFITDLEHTDLANVSIPNDVYMASWLALLQPLFDKGTAFDELLNMNRWAIDFFPNLQIARRPTSQIAQHKYAIPVWLPEQFIRTFQMKHLSSEVKEADTGVCVNDGMIKMHTADTRYAVRDTYQELCKTMNIAW